MSVWYIKCLIQEVVHSISTADGYKWCDFCLSMIGTQDCWKVISFCFVLILNKHVLGSHVFISFQLLFIEAKKNIKWLVFQLLVSAMFELFLVWTPFVYLAKLCYDLTVFFNWQSCLFSSYYILNISDVYTFEFRNSLVGIWVKLLIVFVPDKGFLSMWTNTHC